MLNQSLTIAGRVIQQLIRDRRTMVLIVLVPLVVMTLIGLSFPEGTVLDYIAPALLATLALFFSFLLTGISFLRERSQGTMERLMASPVSRLDIVVGYLFGFFIFALLQTLIIVLFTIYVLGVQYHGDLWQIFVFQIVIIAGAVNLGIFISTFARNEFQMVQFIPLIIFPQIFLCGVIWPVEQMPNYLQWLSKILPLTYGVEGLRNIMLAGQSLLDVGFELAVLVGFAIIMSIIAAITLRRGAAG
ncbi:MAG: ABC transporter permease subunit [Dehalococcoidia bacterium]|nr:ABC transporter permease subunit [Dehalococcoidia bacterium]